MSCTVYTILSRLGPRTAGLAARVHETPEGHDDHVTVHVRR